MKKTWFCLSLAALLLLSSCGGGNHPADTIPGEIREHFSVEETTGQEATAPAVPETELVSVTLTPAPGLTAHLLYPVFRGVPDAVGEKLAAQLSARAEAEFFARVQPPDALAETGASAVYTVLSAEVPYLDSGFASVISCSRVDYTIPEPETGAEREETVFFAYSSFLNLSTGEIISAEKVFSDLPAVLDLLAGGGFRLIGGAGCVNLSDLAEEAKLNARHGVCPPLYFDGEALVILLFSNDGDEASRYSVPVREISRFLLITPMK